MRFGAPWFRADRDRGWGAAAPGQTMMPAIGNGKLRDESASATGVEIGLISLLSLKLLLLAFFILLSALSEFETLKVRTALQSVTEAFDGRLNVAHYRAANGADQDHEHRRLKPAAEQHGLQDPVEEAHDEGKDQEDRRGNRIRHREIPERDRAQHQDRRQLYYG